ncbi:SGNH/GDSL hydrolase family protein [Sutterella sp.]|uniref:SGNH/GDSL hydrolase family protein n=1 Tax=Sutterella sp. TaxID=1981025 RepID=UPI0026DF3B77|nr:SGNH/GDSL hydrolase family protein [Sutterella sp.]MDO5532456.1 SGNH/GDSL hydrolase family protein [Sutterella sp.]
MKKLLLLSVMLSAAGLAQAADRIMVFGDSNTFGWQWTPEMKATRLDPARTWPEVMERALKDSGLDVRVITEGLGGRTTDVDDAIDAGSGIIDGAGMNGLSYLPAALSSHMPLDLVIIMLGTNDFQARLHRTAPEIAVSLGRLAAVTREAQWQSITDFRAPDVLIVTPPKMDTDGGPREAVFKGAKEKSAELAKYAEPVVTAVGAWFMDAADTVPYAGAADKVHLTEAQHAELGAAVACKVKEILEARKKSSE